MTSAGHAAPTRIPSVRPRERLRHNRCMDEIRRRGRPRDVRVEAAVIEATLEEIKEKGLGGATMEAIAARAGVGKTTLYRRWPNKEVLFQFVAGQVTDVFEPVDTG